MTLPFHVAQLQNNIKDISRLVEIHVKMGGKGVGRRDRLDVLNRSAIVLLSACWEFYIENLAGQSFEIIMTSV